MLPREAADAYLEDQLTITLQLETNLKHQLAKATRLQDEYGVVWCSAVWCGAVWCGVA